MSSTGTKPRLEAAIQRAIVAYLRGRGWFVVVFTGSVFQTGVPDLWIHHPRLGQRWIDVKRPGRYSFTPAQRTKWPEWHAAGVGLWILADATQAEYDKLFSPPNWREYWRPSWGRLDETLAALAAERQRELEAA